MNTISPTASLSHENPISSSPPGPENALKYALANSTTTPIVMIAIDYDPLALGYVTSLARPTGKVTGVFLQIELAEKRLQLLKSAFQDIQAASVFGSQARQRALANAKPHPDWVPAPQGLRP